MKKYNFHRLLHLHLLSTATAAATAAMPPRLRHLTPCNEYLNRFQAELIDLWPLYSSIESFEVYDKIKDIVLKSALEVDTAFLTYGHPLIYVDTSHQLLKEAKKYRLETKVICGISSIDILIERLKIEPADPGLQIIDATTLIHKHLEPNPKLSTLLMQIGCFQADRLHLSYVGRADTYRLLTEYLLNYYSAEQPIELIAASYLDDYADLHIHAKLKELPFLYEELNAGMTMYIPAFN